MLSIISSFNQGISAFALLLLFVVVGSHKRHLETLLDFCGDASIWVLEAVC